MVFGMASCAAWSGNVTAVLSELSFFQKNKNTTGSLHEVLGLLYSEAVTSLLLTEVILLGWELLREKLKKIK